MRALSVFTLAVALAGAPNCALKIDWKTHGSYRPAGAENVLVPPPTEEAARLSPIPNLHYVALSFDSVFVRNLPGITGGAVALGLEVIGALPDAKPLRTVAEIETGKAPHGITFFDHVARIEPFLYGGAPLTFSLHLRAVPPSEVKNVQGKQTTAGEVSRVLDPAREASLVPGFELFQMVIDAPTLRTRPWRYQFTLYPLESEFRDKPEMLLTSGRHILLALPPGSAPEDVRALRQEKLVPFLKVKKNQVVWRHDESEFTELPYVLLDVERYRRHPTSDGALRKLFRKLDGYVEQGNLDAARPMIPELLAAIQADPRMTSHEKNLARAWTDYRKSLVDAARARTDGKRDEELEQLAAGVRQLTQVRSQFARILYPDELRDVEYRISKAELRRQELASGGPTGALDESLAAHRKAPAPAPVVDTPAAASVLVQPLKESPPARPKWKRPHEQWWFWTLVGAAVVGAGATAYGLSRLGAAGGPTYPFAPAPIPSAKAVRP